MTVVVEVIDGRHYPVSIDRWAERQSKLESAWWATSFAAIAGAFRAVAAAVPAMQQTFDRLGLGAAALALSGGMRPSKPAWSRFTGPSWQKR